MKKYENRIIIVKRATRLENVLESHNTVGQARFYVKHLGGDFDDYEKEHKQYTESISIVRRNAEELCNVQIVDRNFLPNFIFAPDDIVVVVGQDGLVANTLKYLSMQPVIGVNPDTERWDGVLLPFKPADVKKIAEDTILKRRELKDVCMAKAKVQDGQELLAVNDFFIGQKTHASARYVIKYGGLKEAQCSSGIIVSTGLGSTGWMKSIIAGSSRLSKSIIGTPYGSTQESENITEIDEDYEDEDDYNFRTGRLRGFSAPMETNALMCMMAEGIDDDVSDNLSQNEIDRILDKEDTSLFEAPLGLRLESPILRNVRGSKKISNYKKTERLSKKKKTFGASELSDVVGKWSSTELLFAVREPFPSKTTGTNLVFGTISTKTPLKIESLMGENGVIFSDGIENDFIAFNSGTEAEITLAEKRGKMVV